MKECIFYYFIVAQVDFICDKSNIAEEYSLLNNRVQKIFEAKFGKGIQPGKYTVLSGIPARKEYFIWNAEHVKFLEKNYGIKDFNKNMSHTFEVDQEKVVLKLGGNNIVYNTDIHKNDALRCLSEVGNTYFLYMYSETKELKEFKSYYNRFKNQVSINESDPRLNYLFRIHSQIKEETNEFREFYNIKSFYGVKI